MQVFGDPFYRKGPNDQGIGWNVLMSLQRVGIGFGLAALVGIPLGFVLGRFAFAHAMAAPIISLLRPVSPLAWLPIGLMVFKAANPAAIWVIFVSSLWPMVVNTAVGVQRVPQDYLNVARVLNLSEWKVFTRILFPAVLPYMITGVRLSIGVAWLVIVAAEMLTGGVGIGFWVWDEWNNLKVEHIMIAILTIGVVGLLLAFTLFAGLSVSYRLLMLAGFVLLCGIWVATIFLSGLKMYRAILLLYALGYAVTVLSALAARPWGLEGLLGGFVLGHFVLFVGMWMITAWHYRSRMTISYEFARRETRYPSLMLIGLLYNLGALDIEAGRLEDARPRLEKTRLLAQTFGDRQLAAAAAIRLARVSAEIGDLAGARVVNAAGLVEAFEQGMRLDVLSSVHLTAYLEALDGNPVRGARLLGALVESDAETGVAIEAADELSIMVTRCALRERLDEPELEAAFVQGAGLSFGDAVELALEALGRRPPLEASPSSS